MCVPIFDTCVFFHGLLLHTTSFFELLIVLWFFNSNAEVFLYSLLWSNTLPSTTTLISFDRGILPLFSATQSTEHTCQNNIKLLYVIERGRCWHIKDPTTALLPHCKKIESMGKHENNFNFRWEISGNTIEPNYFYSWFYYVFYITESISS